MPHGVAAILQFALLLLALYGALLGARFVLLAIRLLRAVIQFPRGRAIDAGVLPAEIGKVFATPLRELQALGFAPLGWFEQQRMLRIRHGVTPVALLRHASEPVCALVGLADPPEATSLFVLRFWTFFDDNSALLTMNGGAHLILGTLPRVQVVDRYLPRLDDQWRLHLDQLASTRGARQPRQLTLDQVLVAIEAIDQEHIAQLQQQRHLGRALVDETCRLTLRGALHAAWLSYWASGRAAGLQRTAQAVYRLAGAKPPEVPLALEVAAFRGSEELRAAPLEPRYRWLLFGLTLAATALAATLVFGVTTMALIVATVLLHELGHYGAMRLFGYRDTSIFFIPFFGGAVTGRKPDARLYEELLVLLAGPLPGLVLAAALLFAGLGTGPPWVVDAIRILAFVNAFNLLPILPLDGGRMVHALLFARQPIADALARLFAVVAFLWIGWRLHSLGLVLLGLVGVVTIPYGFRLATLRKKFEAARAHARASAPAALVAGPAATSAVDVYHDDVALAFLMIRLWITHPLAFAQKSTLVRALLLRSQSTRRVGVLPALLWLTLYGAALVFGAVVTTRSLLR